MDKKIKLFVLLGPLYLVVLSFLYTFSFWQNFDFNIYQFIGVNNVITYSINNVVLLLVTSGLILTTPYFVKWLDTVVLNFSNIEKSNLEELSEKESENIHKKIRKIFINTFYLIVIVLILLAIALIPLIGVKDTIIIYLFGALIIVFLKFFGNYFDFDSITKRAYITFLAAPLILTVFDGVVDATKIKNGLEYSYIETTELREYDREHTKLIYLGYSSDYFFFTTQSENPPIIIKRFEDFNRMYFKKFKKGNKASSILNYYHDLFGFQ